MNKQEAMLKVHTSVVLSQVASLEETVLEGIIDQALAHPVGVDRWPCYERLKRQANKITGWYAARNELSTCRHYEAMIGLIDELLPVASENDLPDYDELARRRREGGGFRHISEILDDFLADLEKRRQRHLDDYAG